MGDVSHQNQRRVHEDQEVSQLLTHQAQPLAAETVGCGPSLSFEFACSPTSQTQSPAVLRDAHAVPIFSSAVFPPGTQIPHPAFGMVFTHPSELTLCPFPDSQPVSSIKHRRLPVYLQHPRQMNYWRVYPQYTESLQPLGVPTDHSHPVEANTRVGACCAGTFKFTLTPPSSSSFNVHPLVRPVQAASADSGLYSILDAHPPFLHFEYAFTPVPPVAVPASGSQFLSCPAHMYSTVGSGAPASISALQQHHWPFAYPMRFPGSAPILASLPNSSPAVLQVASASVPAPEFSVVAPAPLANRSVLTMIAAAAPETDCAELAELRDEDSDSEEDGLSDSGSFDGQHPAHTSGAEATPLAHAGGVSRAAPGQGAGIYSGTGKRSRDLRQLSGCTSSFKQRHLGLVRHALEHTREKLFLCTGKFAPCTAAFNHRSSFQDHLTAHPTAPCLFYGCGSVLASRSALSVHMRIHTGASPYYCNNTSCGLSFSTKAKLDRHKPKHKPAQDAHLQASSRCSVSASSGPMQ